MADFRHEVRSPEGLIQICAQLISRRSRHFFYFAGNIPENAEIPAVDEKMLSKYEVPRDKHHASRLRKSGKASVRYVRFERQFLLLATHGESVFHGERRFSDVRRVPLRLLGYSISFLNTRASVRIEQRQFQVLKDHFRIIATKYPCEILGAEINRLTFTRYRPVVGQLLQLVRMVNRERAAFGLSPVPRDAVRLRREPIKVYED